MTANVSISSMENPELDVTLLFSDGITVRGNKAMLRICSDYFEQIFAQSQPDEQSVTVNWKGVNADVVQRMIKLLHLESWKFYCHDDDENCGLSVPLLVDIAILSHNLQLFQLYQSACHWAAQPSRRRQSILHCLQYEGTGVKLLIDLMGHGEGVWKCVKPDDLLSEPAQVMVLSKNHIIQIYEMQAGRTMPRYRLPQADEGSPYVKADDIPSSLNPHPDCDFKLKLPIRKSAAYPDGTVTFHLSKETLLRNSERLRKIVGPEMTEYYCKDTDPITHVQPFVHFFQWMMYPLESQSLRVQELQTIVGFADNYKFPRKFFSNNLFLYSHPLYEQKERFGFLKFAVINEHFDNLVEFFRVCEPEDIVVFLRAPYSHVWLKESEMGEEVIAANPQWEMYTFEVAVAMLEKLDELEAT